MKKFIPFVLVLVAGIFCLSGCFTVPEGYQKKPHSRSQAQSYIKSYLNAETIIISESYDDIKDEYGAKIRRWGAEYNGVSFYVVSRQATVYDSTGEFAKYYYKLSTDFNLCATGKIFASIPNEDSLLKIFGGEEFRRYRDEVYIEVKMADRADFDSAYGQAKMLFDTVKNNYQAIPLNFVFKSKMGENDFSVAYIDKFNEDNYDFVLGQYCVIKNMYLDASEFSTEEIIDYNNKYGRKFRAVKGEQNYTFDDLSLLNVSIPSITFETFYEVLKRFGFEVTGSKDHFSFVGTDGADYSVSRTYFFNNNNSTVYYYLRNNQQVKFTLTYGYNNYFNEKEILSVSGINLTKD